MSSKSERLREKMACFSKIVYSNFNIELKSNICMHIKILFVEFRIFVHLDNKIIFGILFLHKILVTGDRDALSAVCAGFGTVMKHFIVITFSFINNVLTKLFVKIILAFHWTNFVSSMTCSASFGAKFAT